MEERKDYAPFTMSHFWAIVIFSVILLIALVVYNSNKPHYVMNPQEALEQITQKAEFVDAYKMAEILRQNDSLFRIIDVRDPMKYKSSHIEGAINIPMGRLFDKKFSNMLNKSEKINVLLGDKSTESIISYMLLSQEGYKNIRAVKFGYDFVKNHIVENFSPMSGKYDDSRAYYDFNKIVKSTAGNAVGNTAPAAKKKAPVKKKKKAVEEEGGC